jgi:hypothetical protein
LTSPISPTQQRLKEKLLLLLLLLHGPNDQSQRRFLQYINRLLRAVEVESIGRSVDRLALVGSFVMVISQPGINRYIYCYSSRK